MDKIDIKSLSKDELTRRFETLGIPVYRAKQAFRWLYQGMSRSFDGMTDIPLDLRAKLKEHFHITHMTALDSKRSSIDGTTKYLFKLEDGNTIETVFLPEDRRSTVCISSQVGCKYACSFCASAPFGFKRSLHVCEILDQVISVKRSHPDSAITNLVFMGIGEPFDNYDNVMRAIRILNDKDAFCIGARKITISTCGIIPGIERLKGEGIQIELSVSLHSAVDEVRSKLVPINKKYPIKDLIVACKDYIKATGRVITFEYILMKGVNTSKEDALKLAALLKGMNCKVNTILYNQVRSLGYAVPSKEEAAAFIKTLKASGINAMHRKSKGEDIDAGCGQLRIANL